MAIFGFYSKTHERMLNSQHSYASIYEDIKCKEVKVTIVRNVNELPSFLDDFEPVGEVVRYIKKCY